MTVENNETNPTVHIYRNFRAILAHLKKRTLAGYQPQERLQRILVRIL